MQSKEIVSLCFFVLSFLFTGEAFADLAQDLEIPYYGSGVLDTYGTYSWPGTASYGGYNGNISYTPTSPSVSTAIGNRTPYQLMLEYGNYNNVNTHTILAARVRVTSIDNNTVQLSFWIRKCGFVGSSSYGQSGVLQVRTGYPIDPGVVKMSTPVAAATTDYSTVSFYVSRSDFTSDTKYYYVSFAPYGANENNPDQMWYGSAIKVVCRNWSPPPPPPTPVASFTATPTSGTEPLTVNFNGSSSIGAMTYEWNFGDGSPNASGVITSHTYQGAGTYSPYLMITDTYGFSHCSPIQTITVTPTSGSPPSSFLGLIISGSVGPSDTLRTVFDNMTTIAHETLSGRAYDFIRAYSPSPIDFNGDGTTDTAGEASAANVSAGFFWLMNHPSLRSDSQVFIYICDHGSQATATEPGRIWLNKNEFLEPNDVASRILQLLQSTPLQPSNVIVLISSCFSGTFIPDVGRTGVVCMTSTDEDEFGYAFDGSIWWDKRFFEEIQSGQSLGSSFTRAIHTRQTQQIDANGNGIANEAADQLIADGITIGLSTTTPITSPLIYTYATPSQTQTAMLSCRIMVFGNSVTRVAIGSTPDNNTGNSYVIVPDQPMTQSQPGSVYWEANLRFSQIGIHHVFVSAENSSGCSTTESFEVHVTNLLPTPSFTYTTNAETGCVSFDASATVNATEYHWDFGDGHTAQGITCSHVFEPGGHYVVLRAVNSYGAILRVASLTVPDRESEKQSQIPVGGCSQSPGGTGGLQPLLLLAVLLLIPRKRKASHHS